MQQNIKRKLPNKTIPDAEMMKILCPSLGSVCAQHKPISPLHIMSQCKCYDFVIDLILLIHSKDIYLILLDFICELHNHDRTSYYLLFCKQNKCLIILNAGSSRNLLKTLLEEDGQGGTATSPFFCCFPQVLWLGVMQLYESLTFYAEK